jgi:uncharacterized protein
MAGLFELFLDAHSRYRFRLTAPDGTVMAVSKAFDDKPSAVSRIRHVREYAGTGLVRDLTAGEPLMPESLISADAVPQGGFSLLARQPVPCRRGVRRGGAGVRVDLFPLRFFHVRGRRRCR